MKTYGVLISIGEIRQICLTHKDAARASICQLCSVTVHALSLVFNMILEMLSAAFSASHSLQVFPFQM